MSNAPQTEVSRLPIGVASRIIRAAETVDHLEADLDATVARGLPLGEVHDRYAAAVEDLVEAAYAEARAIEDEAEHDHPLAAGQPLPAGARRIAGELVAYAQDLEERRGL